jgi:hypothetical protein
MDYIDRVDRIETLLQEWHEAGRARFEKDAPNLNWDEYEPKVAKPKSKYIYLDAGGSGAFMVDRADDRVYCIKGYGVPDKRKCVGTLDKITGADLYRCQWWRLR